MNRRTFLLALAAAGLSAPAAARFAAAGPTWDRGDPAEADDCDAITSLAGRSNASSFLGRAAGTVLLERVDLDLDVARRPDGLVVDGALSASYRFLYRPGGHPGHVPGDFAAPEAVP